MAKRIVLVEPNAERPELVERCRALGLEPVAVMDAVYAGKEPWDCPTVCAEEIGLDMMVHAVGDNHAAGLYAANSEDWPALVDAAQRLGLPYLEIENPARLIGALAAQDLLAGPCKAVHSVSEAAEAAATMGTPVRVRPLARFGTYSDTIVDDEEEVSLAFERAKKQSPDGWAMVHKPLDGPRYRVVGFHVGRELRPVEVIREECQEGPYPVPFCFVTPAGLPAYEYTNILGLMHEVGRLMPIGHGTAEIEVTLDGGQPRVVAVNVTPGPDPILTKLLRYALGVDLQDEALRLAANEPIVAAPNTDLGAAVCWLRERSGVVDTVSGLDEARGSSGVQEIVLSAKPGDTLRHVVDKATRDRLGYVIATGVMEDDALEAARSAAEQIVIETQRVTA